MASDMVIAPWLKTHRPNGKLMLSVNVESIAATGKADSVPLAGQWSEMPVPHAPTALRHLPNDSLVSTQTLTNSVDLKNEMW